jgi:hypothetical protein
VYLHRPQIDTRYKCSTVLETQAPTTAYSGLPETRQDTALPQLHCLMHEDRAVSDNPRLEIQTHTTEFVGRNGGPHGNGRLDGISFEAGATKRSILPSCRKNRPCHPKKSLLEGMDSISQGLR